MEIICCNICTRNFGRIIGLEIDIRIRIEFKFEHMIVKFFRFQRVYIFASFVFKYNKTSLLKMFDLQHTQKGKAR